MNITDVKYTSPSGKEFTFVFEDVTKETDLKTATFTFPGKDGAYIQSLGRGGRRFPMSCIFTGESCVDEADKFEEALEESGIGSLQHPLYGVRSVVPTGTIKRRDGLVKEVNTSVIEITFSETIADVELLKSSEELSSAINKAAESFVDAAIDEIAVTVTIANTSEMLKVQENVAAAIKAIDDNMMNISVTAGKDKISLNEAVNGAYAALRKVVTKSTKFTEDIRGFASTVFKLIRLPSELACVPGQILTAYTSMARDIIKKFKNDPFGINKVKNQYAVAKMSLEGAICAACEGMVFSCVNSNPAGTSGENDIGFKNREDAVLAAEQIQELFEDFKIFCDKKISQNVSVETDASYEALLEVVTKSVSLILDTAFSLKKRRVITLDRDRQLVELLSELYGDIDSHIDEFISDNDLNIETIKVIPMGTEVAYYV